MISSRLVTDLIAPMQDRVTAFLAKANDAGMGLTVTNAMPGWSYHNYGCAVDVVPLRYGKPVWGDTGADLVLWMQVGKIGESCGLEWAWRWRDNKELAHFQWTGGKTIVQLVNGERIV